MKIYWCLHCERTFQSEDETVYECEYPDCDGHIGDFWDWDSIQSANKGYPKTPQKGKAYPMYGK